MQRAWLWAGAGALVGGVIGASLSPWLTQRLDGAGTERAAVTKEAETSRADNADPKLLSRLENLERSVRALESRRPATGSGAAPPQTGTTSAPTADEQRPPLPPAPVDDPVFEAAVLDVLERAEEWRDSERDVRRSERARQRAEHWANELTTRLALAPAQTSRLIEIQSRLTTDLRTRRQSSPESYVPREQRRAAARALREHAEQELRGLLDHHQLAEYEKLSGDLKLLRSDD